MQGWEIDPYWLEYNTDLNTVFTIDGMVRMPSRPLQSQRDRLVDKTSENSVAPNFKQFPKSVAAVARTAHRLFGQISLPTTVEVFKPSRNSAYGNDLQVSFACWKLKGGKKQTCILREEGHSSDNC
ncbi:hypothetical protein FGIG_10534 [Fasciola gigantica]|uniref:Uncharacterized protein n=1 Tax=Fasciola gigantica TaxID=46835 RepID=A0A504YIF6_FASGI|nr:hypothetical protein FGIG_10534 [Fasciola gigantica]